MLVVSVGGSPSQRSRSGVLLDRSQRWLPSGTETYAVVTGWRREGSEWICYNASWSQS